MEIDEESSSFGLGFTDPILAGINGVEASNELGFASGIELSTDSSELKIENIDTGNDDLLLSQNPSGALNLAQDGDQVLDTSLKLPKDILTNDTNGFTVETIDSLTGDNSDRVEIQRRSSGGTDLAGNSRGKAYDIGKLDGTDFYTDSVRRSDRKDFYKFSVEERGQVEIDLSGLSGNADLYLRNSQGKEIKKSKRNGTASESINHILNPGEYYIQVQSRNKRVSTGYHLGMRFTKTQSLTGSLGKGNAQDVYAFTVNNKEDAYITLDGLNGNVDLYLRDSNNRAIARSKRNGRASEQIEETLVPGDYSVQVKRRNNKVSSDYTLDLGFRLSDLPGSNRSKAYDFGTVDQDQYTKLKESVSRSDRNDFYKFTLEKSADMDISLGGMSDNADLYLRNSRGKVIKNSKNNGTAAESISRILSPGDYYIQVKTRIKRDATDYYLGFELEDAPSDDAGNSRSKALDIGSLLEVRSYSDFVGTGDRRDFYSFTLDWERGVNLSLDGLTGNADLFLLNQQGKVIEKSKRGGTNAEKIEENLAAGTYYVRVQARNNNVNADYTLTLEPEKNQEALTVVKENLNVPGLEDIGFELIDEPVEVEKGVYFIGVGPTPDQFDPIPFNASSAETTKADQLWSGGGLGLDLDGSGVTVGMWEGGQALDTHEAFDDRVSLGDKKSRVSDHATHVAGTIGAGGEESPGMASKVTIKSFDNKKAEGEKYGEIQEMKAFASEIDISNHSYGNSTGWTKNRQIGEWFWMEELDKYSDEDPDFGKYSDYAKELDKVLYDNPHLLSVWAAGNDRTNLYVQSKNQPYYLAFFSNDSKVPSSVEQKYQKGNGKYWYAITNDSVYTTPSKDGDKKDGIETGYDTLAVAQNAKNTLVVGAINDAQKIAKFSSWGPTDDGRIKPDVVANGVDVDSTSSNGDYTTKSGTSMAAPNVTGTAALLHQHYTNLYGSNAKPSSATMKGLLIHTADDIDRKGPDYSHGWGLVDGAAGANFLTDSKAEDGSLLRQDQSYTGSEQSIEVKSDGSESLKVSIVWTDPAGKAHGNGLDERTAVLVNDLDLWIVGPDGKTHRPWTLDPANPEKSALNDKKNSVDNVEQVFIDAPVAGTYTIHVGSDDSFSQKYSLFASGLGNEEITVTSPNGGETRQVGEELNITWEDNVSGNVKLDLYQGDELVAPIVEATETDQSYSWTIPDSIAAGNNYQVKVTSADGTVSDLSDGNFSIEALTDYINVTAPSGGETLVGGEEYSITWESNIIEEAGDNVSIEVYQGDLLSYTYPLLLYNQMSGFTDVDSGTEDETTDGQTFFLPIFTETDGSYTYTQKVPVGLAKGDDYQIKISGENGVYDLSDIFSIDSETFLNVNPLNGGEALEPGETYEITWNDNISGDVVIDLYKGEVLDRTIASIKGVANSPELNSYEWTVPEDIVIGDDYKIQVSHSNKIDDFYIDTWNEEETIMTTGREPVLSGEVVNYDKSDNYFSIEPKKYINVTSPNAGETLVGDESYSITWDSNITGDVKIEVYQGGLLSETVNGAVPGSVTIGSDTIETNPAIENDGSNNWRVFDWLLAEGDDYQIKISSLTDDSIYDFSESFSIDTETYLNLGSLNGGEALKPGRIYTISWDDNIENGDVKIDLHKAGVFDRTIVELDAADLVGITEYEWEVPTDLISGDDYEISIRQNVNYVDFFSSEDFDESEKSVLEGLVRYNYDKSDSYFSIEPSEYIELTSINNGETLEAGETYEITWDTNISGNVRLDLYEGDSPYNFLDYNTIVALHKAAEAKEIADELGLDDYDESLIGGGLAEDGSYTWTVPEDFVAGDEYEFKITSISDDTVYDFSNSKFTVVAPEDYINVTSFNVGEGVTRGETYEITWDSNISGLIQLELYKGDSPYEYYQDTSDTSADDWDSYYQRPLNSSLHLYVVGGGSISDLHKIARWVNAEDGSYEVTIGDRFGLLLAEGDDYRIKLTTLDDGVSTFTDYFSVL